MKTWCSKDWYILQRKRNFFCFGKLSGPREKNKSVLLNLFSSPILCIWSGIWSAFSVQDYNFSWFYILITTFSQAKDTSMLIVPVAKAESRGLGRAPGHKKLAGTPSEIPLQALGTGLWVLLSKAWCFCTDSSHPVNPAVCAVVHS